MSRIPAREGVMDRKPLKPGLAQGAETREVRLKAALKANMARRKAQAKARALKPGGAKKES